MLEIGHLDPSQTIEYIRVQVENFLMLQKATEYEKEAHARKLASM